MHYGNIQVNQEIKRRILCQRLLELSVKSFARFLIHCLPRRRQSCIHLSVFIVFIVLAAGIAAMEDPVRILIRIKGTAPAQQKGFHVCDFKGPLFSRIRHSVYANLFKLRGQGVR